MLSKLMLSRTWLYAILLMSGFVFTKTVEAQISPPSTYTVLTINSYSPNITLNSATQWFRVKTEKLNIAVQAKMQSQGLLNALSTLEIFKEDGGGLIQIEFMDTLRTDSTLRVAATGLDSSVYVYLRVTSISQTCTACSVNNYPTIALTITGVESCAYSPTSCQLVKDTSFEYATLPCANIPNPNTGACTNNPYTGFAACFWTMPIASASTNCSGLGTIPILGTCDYYCNGGHTGTGYAGAYLYSQTLSGSSYVERDYREYITQQMYSPMVTNRMYVVRMWVKRNPAKSYATDIYLNFNNSNYTQPSYNAITGTSGQTIYMGMPTASIWTQLTATIVATGNYTRLTIGNFSPVGSSAASNQNPSITNVSDRAAYYYFDDISILETFSLSASPAPCYASSTITAVPPIAGASYTWTSSPPTPTLSGVTDGSVTVQPPGTTTYSASTVSSSGCMMTSTINVSPTPITLSSSSASFCPGVSGSTTITASGLTTYSWWPHPSISGSLTSPTITVSPTTTTTYTVSGTLTGCPGTYSTTVTVYDISPIISISTSSVICAGTSVAVTTNSPSSLFYLDFDFGASSPNPYTYSTAGSYTIVAGSEEPVLGCQSYSVFPITVVSSGLNPTLTITPSQTICAGTSKTLTVGGATSYTWSNGSTSPSITVMPSVTTTYTVTGRTSCGSSTAAVTVSVIPLPVVTVVASPTAVCSGQSATLTASGASFYNWSTSATTNAIVVSPGATTAYTVWGSNACGTSSAGITVTVTAPPALTAVANPTAICVGSSSTLTASGASTYTWNPGNLSSNPITVSPPATTQYTVTGRTVAGCIATATVMVTVNPQPTLAISGPASVCTGLNINLIASGGVAGTYTWMPCTGTCTTTLKTFAPTVTTTYTLLGQNSYGCIGNVTKTVIVNPRPTITINSPTICPGGTATLTPNGGAQYYWQPSGISSPTMAYSPATTTVYSLTAFGITGTGTSTTNCYSYETATVTVASASVTASSATICLGKTGKITASGASTYTWLPGNLTGGSINVTPTVTTVYTVTGTSAAGCTATATTTVTVGAASSFSVTSTTSNNYPQIGSAVTLSAAVTPAGTYTYNWSPVSGTSAALTFTPTDNAVYTCNVKDHCGTTISTSLCVTVESTLCATPSATVFNNYTTSGVTFSVSNTTITITGTLTLGGGSNILFDKSVLKMGSNARIVVDPTSKLTISDTKVFSCEGMWYGIEAQSNAVSSATINLKAASIEDAYLAVTADNASTNQNNYIISGVSSFNKNYTDISIKNSLPGAGTYPLTMFTSSLTSNASTTSPGNSLKCSGYYSPTVRPRSYAGVYAVNTDQVDILNEGTPSNFNVVKNKDYGLYFTNTNANVYNINFSEFDGSQSTSCDFITHICTTTYNGVAIRSESSGYLKVKPSPTPTTGALTFTNVAYGILANSTKTVDVQYADFKNPAQYTGGFGTTGIGRNAIIANNATEVFRANYNTITQTFGAISSAYTSGPSGSFLLSASENTISAGTGTLSTAVTVQSSVSFSPAAASMRVNGNAISNAGNGILANNIKNGLRISSNAITMAYAASGSFAGIKLTGTENATIDANTISSTGVANTGLSGIYLQLSPACRTQCNTINTVGQSVVFEGNCSSVLFGFNNNLMTNATDGMVLKNNGVIGTQGITAPFANSSGNQWLGSFGNSKTLVMDAGSSAQNSNLVVRNNSNEYPQPQSLNKTNAIPTTDNYGIAIFNSPASIFTVTAGNFNCPTAQTTGMRMAQADTLDDGYVQALNDTVLYNLLSGPVEDAVIVDETKEINRAYVYNVLAGGYTTNHSGLNAFYAQQSDSIVAQYHGVDSLLQSGNYYQAQSQNSQASPVSQIQANQQLVNDALAQYGTNPQAGFTESELDKLNTLANSCPVQQGTAVYQVRTLLSVLYNSSLVFIDNCEFDGKSGRKANSLKVNKAENSFTLYPNPNSGIMYLNYRLTADATISIYDISGRILYQHPLSNHNNQLQIKTDLSNGIYFYTVNDEKGTVLQTDKLIIVK